MKQIVFALCIFLMLMPSFALAEDSILSVLAGIDKKFAESLFVCYHPFEAKDYAPGSIVETGTVKWSCGENAVWKKECKLEDETAWRELRSVWEDEEEKEYECGEQGPVLLTKPPLPRPGPIITYEPAEKPVLVTPPVVPTPVPVSQPVPQPTSAPQPTPSTPAQSQPIVSKELDEQIFDLINVERQSYGLRPLVGNWTLHNAALAHSKFMLNTGAFIHSSTKPVQFGFWAENISYVPQNFFTAQVAVSSWMSSSGHQANILGNYTYTGIGVACTTRFNPNYCYLTQQFGA